MEKLRTLRATIGRPQRIVDRSAVAQFEQEPECRLALSPVISFTTPIPRCCPISPPPSQFSLRPANAVGCATGLPTPHSVGAAALQRQPGRIMFKGEGLMSWGATLAIAML
ncbi:hypothetical protein JMJ77_0004847 [Colletotrichum scovillei]|uniref:Uncharacterized protein n=1 Tax=Colletotrichum scovillei TaxID=1209932 RepID=A0A9P7UGZ6_9PEZI|nr:hypothetical protein JMJ77_0004847 [Colletotrichum scovillei]KAG7076022.1 hypothetical protein JMJ76_0013294 [Colletotrichum scovillei]